MHDAKEIEKVSDMTISELKQLIRDTLYELIDPDHGLELRDIPIVRVMGDEERIMKTLALSPVGGSWVQFSRSHSAVHEDLSHECTLLFRIDLTRSSTQSLDRLHDPR